MERRSGILKQAVSFSYHVNLVKEWNPKWCSSLCWSERWTFPEQTRTQRMQQIQQERHSLGTMWKCSSGRCYHTAAQRNTCFSYQRLEVFESTCSTLLRELRRSVLFGFTFTICGNQHLGMRSIHDAFWPLCFEIDLTSKNSSPAYFGKKDIAE